MTFAMPMALFPAMAAAWGGASVVGSLYSAMSIGVLIVTLFSGWIGRVQRQGAAVVVAAAAWGLAVIAVGFSPTLSGAVFFLALAGAADGISGLYRSVIWNETIPNEMRGRLSAIEMISYMSGPLLGNARAGWMASASGSNAFSISVGGVLCVIGVLACIPILPGFWRYRAEALKS
jgi:MFS family permease